MSVEITRGQRCHRARIARWTPVEVGGGVALAALLLASGSASAQRRRRDAEINGPRLNGIALSAPDGRAQLTLLGVKLADGVLASTGKPIAGARLDGTRLRAATGGPEVWTGALLTGKAS